MANMHDNLMYKGCDQLQQLPTTNVWGVEPDEAKAIKHTMLRLILFHNLNVTAMHIRQNKINALPLVAKMKLQACS